MKELERENAKLKRLVAELSVEKKVLKDVADGNFQALNGVARRWSMRGRNMNSPSDMPAGW
jgi:hypothetical protein